MSCMFQLLESQSVTTEQAYYQKMSRLDRRIQHTVISATNLFLPVVYQVAFNLNIEISFKLNYMEITKDMPR